MTVNMLGIQEDQDSRRTAATWLWPLLPISVAVFCISALIYYHLNHDQIVVASALQTLVATGYRWFGFAPAFLFCILLLTWSSIWFVTGRIERPVGRLGRLLAMTVMLGVFMNLGDGGLVPAFHKGELGYWLADRLVGAFGYYKSLIAVWCITFGSLLLATDFFFSDAFESLRFRGDSLDAPAEGVETAVTDHLKGLAAEQARQEASGVVSGSASTSAVLRTALVPAEGREQKADADDEVEVEPAVEDHVEPAAYTPRRRSYFERRYGIAEETPAEGQSEGGWMERAPLEDGLIEGSGADAHTPVDGVVSAEAVVSESWLPVAPDEQEIENPEVFVDARGLEAELAVEPDQTEREEVGEEGADDRSFASGSPVAVAGEFVGSEEPMEPEEPEESVVRLEGPSPEPLELEAAREVAEADAEAEAEVAAEAEREDLRDEPVVSIPRPDPADVQKENAAKEDAQKEPGQAAVRQQRLFGAGLDEALVAEATETVTSWGRASATFLQRKLRIDYELACQLMVELGARGVVELEADASRGRVLQ
ncbi:MAG: hypothetical protein IT456_16520 [Planctomycetes bacterium]|jgi:hypothetical protein|nr:hypothetical protein [Planctomycetota bacterium]